MTKNFVRTVVGTKAERAVGGNTSTVGKQEGCLWLGQKVGASCTVFICLAVVEGWENFLVRLNRDTIKRGGFVDGL